MKLFQSITEFLLYQLNRPVGWLLFGRLHSRSNGERFKESSGNFERLKKKTQKNGAGLDSVNLLLFALTILYYSK